MNYYTFALRRHLSRIKVLFLCALCKECYTNKHMMVTSKVMVPIYFDGNFNRNKEHNDTVGLSKFSAKITISPRRHCYWLWIYAAFLNFTRHTHWCHHYWNVIRRLWSRPLFGLRNCLANECQSAEFLFVWEFGGTPLLPTRFRVRRHFTRLRY